MTPKYCNKVLKSHHWFNPINMELNLNYTGRFIMFSVITNIYNKKNKRTYLNGTVNSHRKTEKSFF
jgi:hypothetical protein